MRTHLAEAGVEVSVHGPFHNLSLGARDEHIRSYSLDALAASLEAARAFHSPQVVFHTGYLPQFPPKTRARWLDTFSQSLEQLLTRAAELGVRLAMENTYEPDLTLFEEIFERFPSPALGMCLDTSHATCFGRIEPAAWSRRFADRICHVHCSDNDGRDDLHLGLGTGVVNFRALLQPLARIGSSAGVTLEVSAEDAAVVARLPGASGQHADRYRSHHERNHSRSGARRSFPRSCRKCATTLTACFATTTSRSRSTAR